MRSELYGPPPSGPSPHVPPVPASADALAAATPHTTAWLTLPGAAGTEIVAYDLDKAKPYVVIDGVRATKDLNGYAIIPMASGGSKKLSVRSTVPGFTTLTFDGRKVYVSPRPPVMMIVAYFAAGIGAILIGIGFLGGLGAMVGIAGSYGAAAWLRAARNKTVPYVVLIAAGVLLGALGVPALIERLGI